jgi:SM-20-related protein
VNQVLESQLNIVADGLAEKGLAVVNHFLSASEVKAITSLDDFQNALLHFKKAGVGKAGDKLINESVRGDYIQWVDKSLVAEPLQLFMLRLEELIQFLNQSLFLSLKDYEVHQTVYPVGAFYKRHLDQFKEDDHRKLSVICYLNEGWLPQHGGQLRVYFPESTLDVLPEAGRLVCFRSDLLEHEVLPATRERMSITGWILDRPHWM